MQPRLVTQCMRIRNPSRARLINNKVLGLTLDNLNIISIDAHCPIFGQFASLLRDNGVLPITAVNSIPIVSTCQLDHALRCFTTRSVSVGVKSSPAEVAIKASVSDLLEDYIAGCLLAADVGASCYSYDSEHQRVLVNADIDYRAHHHLIRLVSRPYSSPTSLQVQLLLICGLMAAARCALVDSIRNTVYVPFLWDLLQQVINAGDRLEQPLRVFIQSLSNPNADIDGASRAMVGSILAASSKSVWTMGRGIVVARATEIEPWPAQEAGETIRGRSIEFPLVGLVSVVKF